MIFNSSARQEHFDFNENDQRSLFGVSKKREEGSEEEGLNDDDDRHCDDHHGDDPDCKDEYVHETVETLSP